MESEYSAIEGGKQHVTNLDKYLSALPANKNPFEIERLLHAPIEKVWSAISSKDEMDNWYFKIDSFKPVVGFTFQFSGTGRKGETYIHPLRNKRSGADEKNKLYGGMKVLQVIHW